MARVYGNWIDLNNEITQVDEKGKNKLYKDKEALQSYLTYIKENTRKFKDEVTRVRTLTKEGVYDKIFDNVPDTIIREMTRLAYSFNFKYQSFMACQKFYDAYAVKQYNKDDSEVFIEDYEQHNVRVALYLFQDDYVKARELLIQLMEQTFQPATPVYLNAGIAKRGELSSCYLFIVEDNIESINFITDSVRQASKNAGGCAVDLSRLRPKGTEVNGVPNASKGVIPFAKNIEQSVSYFNQNGRREGSAVCYLNVFHPDIFEFLSAKKINASEKTRLDTLSLGVTIPNKFMELLKEGKSFYTFNVYDIRKKYNVTLNEINMTDYYDTFIKDTDIRKQKHSTSDFMTELAKTQLESGYPYVFYIDNANHNHPLKKLGRVQMSNLCCEVCQLQEVSDIFPYLESHKDVLGNDVVCTLGSLNLVNVVEKGLLKESVEYGIRSLSKVTDLMNMPFLPSVQKANDELRAIGLGAMNLAGLFAKNRVSYGSRESLDIVNSLFSAIRYYALNSSKDLAKETGKTFKGFKESEYYTGEVFIPYINDSFEPITKKAQKVLSKVYIPSIEDWKTLYGEIRQYGLYNGYHLNLAPTQSISYVQNATSSIMPVPSPIENRRYGNMDTYYPMPYMDTITQYFYENETAYKLNNKKIINMSAVIQKHIDQAISTILYVESEIPTNELVSLYFYAWEVGLKSLYYTRSQTLQNIECESCSV